MRSVHLLGLGFVIGMTALGALTSAMTYRWAQIAYPESAATAPAQQAAGQPTGSMSAVAAEGKTIFSQKCSGCHTIGGGKGMGPDLKGVTAQRTNDWLVQFITAPDKMIASGDTTATQLVKEFGGVPMPNLGVTADQAAQLLAYIDFQGGGTGSTASTAVPPSAPAGSPATSPTIAEAPTASVAAPSPSAVAAGSTSAPATVAIAPTSPVAAPASSTSSPAQASQGKTLFDQKCGSCHTIGGGKRMGPDLKGVASQRPHDWLVQIIVAPDKLIASGDPTVTQLVKDYGGVPMPNMGITPDQAEQILAYIQQ